MNYLCEENMDSGNFDFHVYNDVTVDLESIVTAVIEINAVKRQFSTVRSVNSLLMNVWKNYNYSQL